MKFIVVGARGQLGQELVHMLTEREAEYVAFGSDELNITNRQQVFDVFANENPDVVLDAAAYTAVDAAEDEGKEINWKVNSEGTKNLADASNLVGAKLLFVSTDYVFDGTKEEPYLETDNVGPKNEYGKAKLAGEKAVQESGADYYIIRTSWVFGHFGKNFVYTMKRLGEKLDNLTVVNDQKGRPTWTYTLADFMLHLVDVSAPYGIYNLSNDGQATWFEFAKEILKGVDVKVNPVSSDAFPTKAYRPANSVLDLNKAKSTGFMIPSWKEALKAFEENDAK